MRNLLEYPVTRDEVLGFLDGIGRGLDAKLIGDMSPVLLDHVKKIVGAAFELRDGFDRRGREKAMGFVTPFAEATALIYAVDFKEPPPPPAPRPPEPMTKNDITVLRLALEAGDHLRWEPVRAALGEGRATATLSRLKRAEALEHVRYDHYRITERGRIALALAKEKS